MADESSRRNPRKWIRLTSENNTQTEKYEPWEINCPYDDCGGYISTWGYDPSSKKCPTCGRGVEFAIRGVESDE